MQEACLQAEHDGISGAPSPWTSPSAPASSARTWTHRCSRRCSVGQQTTLPSSWLDIEQQCHYLPAVNRTPKQQQ